MTRQRFSWCEALWSAVARHRFSYVRSTFSESGSAARKGGVTADAVDNPK